ncbi:hypothetical protein [Bradyrhizobium sp. SZCCHNR1039]|uniref:hypothetical protein n=1 Tax=Bradyrhizobium sp. SZCCHNR1039 TaxID=3057350 RepID=UPI00291704E8|nr:hypothetical protein [Bradyrhizobium sp. SZCCHNR1039]
MDIKFEDNLRVGAIVPRPLVEAIDAEARRELLTRSTWIRRTILNALANRPAEAKASA